MKQEIIRLKNVCKSYEMGDSVVEAVCHADITINKGDFIAIVGPSGSGKSTMMNLVGALDLATKGDIFLDNINIEHLEESELAQIRGRKIGFVFQTFNLIPTLTALENVTLPMIFQDVPLDERKERAEKLLIDIGLGHRLDHLPSELSGGERQRVALARMGIGKQTIRTSNRIKELADMYAAGKMNAVEYLRQSLLAEYALTYQYFDLTQSGEKMYAYLERQTRDKGLKDVLGGIKREMKRRKLFYMSERARIEHEFRKKDSNL